MTARRFIVDADVLVRCRREQRVGADVEQKLRWSKEQSTGDGLLSAALKL